METKRKDYYFKVFDYKLQAIVKAQAVSGDDVVSFLEGKKAVMIGDALGRFSQAYKDKLTVSEWQLKDGCEMIDPVMLAQVAHDEYIVRPDSYRKADPLYLRDADVSQPKSKPRKIV